MSSWSVAIKPQERLAEAKAELEGSGATVVTFAMDVGSEADWSATVEAIVRPH